MGYKEKWIKEGQAKAAEEFKKTKEEHYKRGRVEGEEKATEEFKQIAIKTVTSAVVGGLLAVAAEIIGSGYLTADFFSGFMVGLLAGAGIGFGFGMLFMIKRLIQGNRSETP